MYTQIDRYVLSLVEHSSVDKTAWNIERVRQGKPASWNYIDGCMLVALLVFNASPMPEMHAIGY